MKTNSVIMMAVWSAVTAFSVTAIGAETGFEVTDQGGRIEIRDGGRVVFGWQHAALKEPKGGESFAGSAFAHPLCTPAGFEMTQIQPADHLHHLGVWWPWKMVRVKDSQYVTWELQKGEGHHVAVSAKVAARSADAVVLELENRHEIKPEGGDYMPVVKEQATLRFSRMGDDAYLLDVTIQHSPLGDEKVEIPKYRYSGFSWRGPPSWNKENSRMRTSGGHDRGNANGEEARWLTVDGETGTGRATMLMMSGATKNAAASERLRVWNDAAYDGAAFVNFNPVVMETIPLTPERKEVSLRRYRLVIADRVIEPKEAEALWREWL